MATIYQQAEIHPSKNELLARWAPSQPWFAGEPSGPVSAVAAFRFDDPAGQVGVEVLLVRFGDGPVLQVPVTYRGDRLEGADDDLIGTMEHTALGRRWVYDGLADPVYLAAVVSVAVTGGRQSDQFVIDSGDTPVLRASTATVSGTGIPGEPVAALPPIGAIETSSRGSESIAKSGEVRVSVARVPAAVPLAEATDSPAPIVSESLLGMWPGVTTPVVVARVDVIARPGA